MRDELLNGEIFYSLKEAKNLIEMLRKEYNTIRPYSSLGYKPPSPAAIVLTPAAFQLAELTLWLDQISGAGHLLGADE
jgi:transposase InsO family protein